MRSRARAGGAASHTLIRHPLIAAALVAAALFPSLARAAGADAHVDLAPLLLGLVLVLVGAKLGGALFERLRLPAVLGELLAGILIGNLGLAGYHGFDVFRTDPSLSLLAEIGVVFLLFEVGLESDVEKMRAVGMSSLLVATLGVVAPALLGWGAAWAFFPQESPLIHAFVGATLCATSVGITARVLAELGKVTSPEGQIILGAAVIDDVMGLVVLAVVAGVIRAANAGGEFAPIGVLWIVLKALAFLAGALLVGRFLAARAFHLASKLSGQGLLLVTGLVICFGFAWLAAAIGLAPIVGAFAAGLILEPVHYQELRDRGEHDLHESMRPLTTLLVPVFFVLMGMRVDLASFARTDILAFAAVLTVAAVIGKQACSLGVLERGVDRLAVGLGMIPRGEVGLIFAGIGATLTLKGERVINDATFSAVVMMVAITTLVTPPLLAWRLRRGARAPAPRR